MRIDLYCSKRQSLLAPSTLIGLADRLGVLCAQADPSLRGAKRRGNLQPLLHLFAGLLRYARNDETVQNAAVAVIPTS